MALFPIKHAAIIGRLETEGSEGTYSDPNSNTYFDARVITPVELSTNYEIDADVGNIAAGRYGRQIATVGQISATLTFSVPVYPGADVVTAPTWWKFAEACGWEVITHTTTGIELVQRENTCRTMSFIMQDVLCSSTRAAVHYQMRGGNGNFEIVGDGVGNTMRANFEFQCVLQDVVDEATPLSLTGFETTKPETLKNASFTIGGNARQISTFNLNSGNTVTPVVDQSQAEGISHFTITDKVPTITVNPYMDTVANDDWHNDLITEATQEIILTTGSVQPYHTFTGFKCQATTTTPTDREGLRGTERTYQCLAQDGNPTLPLTPDDTCGILIGAR